jgi:hypothetical protein
MTTIFISYAREDTQRAEQLAWEFRMRGADVWWDQNLHSGERYIETILRQIQHADHVLILLSEHSAASTWVSFEVGAARARELAAGRDILKVAHIDGSEVPGFIGERQSTPMQSGNDAELMELLPAFGLMPEIDYKPPSGQADASLTVFRAGGQWMELIASHRGLDCVLVDSGEERARIQWSIGKDDLAEPGIAIGEPRPDRGWSTFSIKHMQDWRWSPALFTQRDGPPPHESFETALRELIEQVEGF